jgi:two-component system, chemotaxis family, sensor kinase CheA
MSRTPSTGDSAGAGAGIDLAQFHQVFFEEARENLERMEQQLLELDVEAADDEALNAVFRCAHSVKGGAATFGFTDVAELTHRMETLLDKLRRHELAPSASMVDVLLQAGDALHAQLARHRNGGEGPAPDTAALLAHIGSLSAGAAAALPAPARAAAAQPASDAAPPPPPPPLRRELELRVGPLAVPAQADQLIELFGEIAELGTIEPLDGGCSADGMRRFKVVTDSSDGDLLDLFTFHVAREQLALHPLSPGFGFHPGAPGAPAAGADDPAFGLFDSPAAADTTAPSAAATATSRPEAALVPASVPAMLPAVVPAVAQASTLRVPVEKVDQLINLVGELVITQAMLAQHRDGMDPALYRPLAKGLADLERNTRDLQQAVMSIRMIPMSTVYSRFPRMLRELAASLGKKVDFVTQGEATELDKGLVERITDPLTHLVRNSCDHGIERPAERLARGKPETGTLTVAASHQGGSIVIEVRDDGRGLSREMLLKKAHEKGLDAPDSLSDSEVWNLIFAPGFSTAEVVTEVSGAASAWTWSRRTSAPSAARWRSPPRRASA